MKLLSIAAVGALCTPIVFKHLAAPALAETANSAPTQAVAYEIDGVHSFALFRVKHMGVSYTHGRFNEISGTFAFDDKKPEASTVSLEISTESVDTGNGKRDAHLKSPDFFNQKEFPKLSFKSKSVKKGDKGMWTLTGDLTIHGVTKSVTCDVEKVGAADTQMGSRAGFETTFDIKREDFGMKTMLGETGVANDVRLTIALEGVKK